MTNMARYGMWDSPITSKTVVSASIVFDDVLVDPVAEKIYHLEERPRDAGRCVIIDTIAKTDVLPSPYSARTFVQEYGGAAAIVYDSTIYFSNDSGDSVQRDNKIYALDASAGSLPKPVTPENLLWRYANFAVHPKQTHLLVVLREDHTDDPNGDAPQNVHNTICVVNTKTASVNAIVSGADFYATPVINPSGNTLAWQEWDLPDMPWEGGLIYVAGIDVSPAGVSVSRPTLIAGLKGIHSATFPNWVDDARLLYMTDAENRYQNPFVYDTMTRRSTAVLKTALKQDFAEPAWYLGMYPYAILDGGKYGAFTAFQSRGNILYIIDLSGHSEPVEIKPFAYTIAQYVRTVTRNTFVFTGTEQAAPGGVVLGTVSGSSGSYGVDFKVLKESAPLPPELVPYISTPRPLELTSEEDKHVIYAVYYPPTNPDYTPPSEEKPPCIVNVHGGPTGLEPQSLDWTKMFYTSRGFAWLDVNYRGSSGYGRDYIEQLNGNWGIYDVDDCREAATIVAKDGLVDLKRIAIRGGSAGGYTTLSSLTFAKDPTFYKTACSAFGGVTDTTLLTAIMEKFEMRYMYTLFGRPPDNGAWDVRSLIKNITNASTGRPNLSVPLLVLHGDMDRVVLPVVARGFLKNITDQVPRGQLEFAFYPEEGHHWHLAATIEDALEHEYGWYRKNLL